MLRVLPLTAYQRTGEKGMMVAVNGSWELRKGAGDANADVTNHVLKDATTAIAKTHMSCPHRRMEAKGGGNVT